MRRILGFLAMMTMVLLYTAGCNAEPTMARTMHRPEVSLSGVPYTDPFSETDYDNYSLGTDMGKMDWDTMAADHEENHTVYQALFAYDVQERAAARAEGDTSLPLLRIYRYDLFPFTTGEYDPEEKVWFRGKQRLYVVFDLYGDKWWYDEEDLIPIPAPGAYGLLEDLVFSQTFVPNDEPENTIEVHGHFVTEDRRGNRVNYIIHQNGTVTRKETDATYAATRKLTEQEIAAVYAIKYAYVYANVTRPTYGIIRDSHSRADDLFFVHEEMGNQRWSLTGDAIDGFMTLISDGWQNEGSPVEEYGFQAVMRMNCDTGDQGGEVLRFSVERIRKTDGEQVFSRTYTLCENGAVVRDYGYPAELMNINMTVYQLIVNRFLVSETRFDVPAIVSFLNSQSTQSS